MGINENHIVARDNSLPCSELDGEVFLLSEAAGQYYNLNAVASQVWQLVKQPITVKALVATLMAEFKVDYAECFQDVTELLSTLCADKLVTITESTPTN